ncbi:MAG: hypothetical protein GWP50_06855 [Proteobacteria bacterium]|nr:hypothetical protein [Pseudomonadota bacterium]
MPDCFPGLHVLIFSFLMVACSPSEQASDDDVVGAAFIVPAELGSPVELWASSCNQIKPKLVINDVTQVNVVHSSTYILEDDGSKTPFYESRPGSGCSSYVEGIQFTHVRIENEQGTAVEGWVDDKFLYQDKYANFYRKPLSGVQAYEPDRASNRLGNYSIMLGSDPEKIDTCGIHLAALFVDRFSEKDEFETSDERDARLHAYGPSYFDNGFTYVFKKKIFRPTYDADRQEFDLSPNFPIYKDSFWNLTTDKRVGFSTNQILIEDFCATDLGYREHKFGRWPEEKRSFPRAVLRFNPSKVPDELQGFGFQKKISVPIEKAKIVKDRLEILIGITPNKSPRVTRNTAFSSQAPDDHFTHLEGDLSFIAIRDSESGEVFYSYIDKSYQQRILTDLRVQLSYAKFEVGDLNLSSDTTKLDPALSLAVSKGLILEPEISFQNLLTLIVHNQRNAW